MVKGKFLEPVKNNGQVNAPLQFKVKYDTDRAKKIRPRNVFEYTPAEENIKNRLRSSKKK